MQEKAIKTTLEKEPEKKEQESTSEKEEKPKIVINKKIVIKCNDINDLKESFDLVKSNDNYINNILKIQPFYCHFIRIMLNNNGNHFIIYVLKSLRIRHIGICRYCAIIHSYIPAVLIFHNTVTDYSVTGVNS